MRLQPIREDQKGGRLLAQTAAALVRPRLKVDFAVKARVFAPMVAVS